MNVIINGVNSDTINGLQILSLPPITKPRMRTSIATIDGRPGDIVTPLGYEAYNKTIKILLHDTYDLPAIMAYFNQSGTIIFSNDPDMVYTFETIEAINYERAVKFKTASVTIHVQPYKTSASEQPATGESDSFTDSEPYLFRQTQGGANMEIDEIVGGSIAWNQLIENGDFADGVEKWDTVRATKSVADGVLTGTCNAAGTMYLMQNHASSRVGHVCFVCVDYKPSVSGTIACSITRTSINVNGVFTDRNVAENQWVHKEALARPDTAESGGSGFRIGYTTNVAVGDTLSIKNVMIFDLTLMFGSEIADYIYAQEQATAGAGVELAKKWAGIKGYIPYDAGSLKSVSNVSAHKMVGFNQLPVAPAFKTYTTTLDKSSAVFCLPNIPYYFGFSKIVGATSWRLCIKAWDEDENMITDTLPATVNFGNGFTWTSAQNLWRNGSNNTNKSWGFTFNRPCWVQFSFGDGDTANTNTMEEASFNISDPQRNGQYEPYKTWSYALDSSLTLRGIPKLDANNNLYYDGDIYESDGTVTRRYAIVDLGTRTWNYNDATNAYFFASVPGKALGNYNIVCSRYALTTGYGTADMTDKQIKGHATSNAVFVKDSAYTDAAAFKTAMSGVYLVYELATPTTETADPYTNPQVCYPGGTEEYIDERTIPVPVGHNTRYLVPIEMTVTNSGNTDSAPTMTITGSGAIEVTIDGLIAFEINMPSTGQITIDSAAMDAMDSDNNLANRNVSGDYNNLRLSPGSHTIIVNGDASSVSIRNASRWL